MAEALFVTLQPELIIVVISFYILYKVAQFRNRSENLKMFFYYAVAMTIFAVVNLLSSAGDNRIAFLNKPAGFLINFLYMICISWGSFTWFRYEETVLDSGLLKGRVRKILWQLPIFIFLILCLISWKTGWLFEVNDTGLYIRGKYWYLQFVFCYCYMVVAFVKVLIYRLTHRDAAREKAHRALLFNTVILLVGFVLQVEFGNAYIAAAAVIGIVVSYMELCTTEEREILEKETNAALLAETQRQKEALQVALDNFKQADYDRRTDFLTGLRNRQDMFELLQDTLSGKRGQITAMYMMDIDNFKMLNDHYGHTYGDRCLQQIGKALNEYGAANNIIFYRYGGEEMLGIGLGDKSEAPEHAEALVRLISDLGIRRDDMPAGVVTISLGYTTNNRRYEKMIDYADTAMYQAKGSGKNRSTCYEDMPPRTCSVN